MSDLLSTAEVARLLRVRPARVRELVRTGLCSPARVGSGYRFDFQDVVALRAAHELTRQKVPPAGVRRAVERLAQELGRDRPLSGLRLFADGRRVAVRDGGTAWQPETGQILLEFDVAELAAEVSAIRDAPRAARKRRARAEESFERGVELETSDASAAAAAYAAAIAEDPDLVDAYVNLGRLRHEAGDPGAAMRLYLQALERQPDDPLLHFNLAVALEDSEGPQKAVTHYERALELDPGFADAHYNVAGLYELMGRSIDALRHYHAYKRLIEP